MRTFEPLGASEATGGVLRTLLDLILPAECGGCGAQGTEWCAACANELAGEPVRLSPRVDAGVPCWALGGYRGVRRRTVIAAKERGRRDLAEPLGAGLAAGLAALRRAGELDPPELAPLVLVPAPTRRRAARERGGDPVTRMARVAARGTPRCTVEPVLWTGRGAKDSVGLSGPQRRSNLVGRVLARELRAPASANVVLVDDVLTTGVTAAESVRALGEKGTAVTAVLVVCAAGRLTIA